MRKAGEVYVCNRVLMNLQIQNASTVIGLSKPWRSTRVRGRFTDEKTRSLPISPQSSVNKSMWLPIFINLGPIFIAQFHFSFCFYFIILVVNWWLEIGLSKIRMKLLKIVWHCRRLYQFILVNCCDPMLDFRLLKIGVRLSKACSGSVEYY